MQYTPNKLGQVMIPSPAILADLAEASGRCRDDVSWTGESLADALKFTRTGNDARVAEAERMIDSIAADLDLEASEWQNDVAGAYPDVPAFLAGQPENMRRRVTNESNRAPVRVWVDVTSSAGLSHVLLAQRGTAALALVMSLIREGRAVELFTYTSLSGRTNGQSVIAVRMLTSPIDLSSVAHCLTSQAYARTLCYGFSHSIGGGGSWSKHGAAMAEFKTRQKAHQTKVLEGLFTPGDVLLPPPHYNDEVIKSPIEWVNARLAECREVSSE